MCGIYESNLIKYLACTLSGRAIEEKREVALQYFWHPTYPVGSELCIDELVRNVAPGIISELEIFRIFRKL